MYNRYLRNDQGGYTRVPVPPPKPPCTPTPCEPPPPPCEPPPPVCSPDAEHAADAGKALGRILQKLRLQNVDTADLLLLLILFFLFEEKADDELLIALGLLLIL